MTLTYDDLVAMVAGMAPDELEPFAALLGPADLALLEQAVGDLGATHWRSDPARMAHHLTEGENQEQLWPYVLLLGHQFAKAIDRSEPRQQWWLPSQYGKGLALDTPVPTATGWTTMGALREGDTVLGGDGHPCTVVLAAEPRQLDCYRVDLHDGASLVADGDHLWRVWDAYADGHGGWRVTDTRALAAHPKRYRLPRMPGLVLPEVDLPMAPYALGVWLGDGTSDGPQLTCAEDELLEHLAAVGEPARRAPATRDPYRCTWAGSQRHPSTFVTRLRQMGVLGNKHVPERYLFAGDKQRLALLQGLLDTDGACSRNQSGYTVVEFTNTKLVLAEAVRTLARSLGMRAKVAEGRATLGGRDCGPKYRVQFTTDLPVFRLSRKAARLYDVPGPRRPPSNAGVRAVTPVPSVPTRCIQVDSPDATYLAGDHLTVTHNTTALKRGITWALDRNPRLRIMYITYDANKATEEAGDVRDFAERHQDVLRFRLRPDRRARGRWQTEQGGGLYATGIKGGITGYPADVVLLDDLLKGWQAAHSETERNTVWNVYVSQVRLRLQALDCAIIAAGTRWHEDDPAARMLAQAVPGEHWHVVRLPALAEAPNPDELDPILRQPDPLGREPGQPLEPRRFPLEEVLARQAVLGSYLAASLEQQRPAPEAGTEILREWFQLEDVLPTVPDEAISSWDTKLKDKQTGDYVVGQVWWRVGGGYWLMDQFRGQWNVATTKAAMALCAVRHPEVELHYYENTGNAPELKEELVRGDPDYLLRDEVADQLGMAQGEREAVQALLRYGMGSLLPVTPEGDKRVRMRAVSPVIEGRNVHLPAGASWVPVYLQEMAAFPNATHDDQVDSTSQALAKLARGPMSLTPADAGHRLPSTLPTGRTQGLGGGIGATILRPRR